MIAREPAAALHVAPDRAEVDVVVPIYNAASDLARCVESVLAKTHGPYRLVLIDDASPDPAVGRFLATIEARRLPHVTVLRNPTNLGFIGTANRGMQRSRADVVLLNSDTVVTVGWLEAILRCAASNPSFGTITPFSNNAEICSFPRFCVNNVWAEDEDPDAWASTLARAAVPTYPDLPTAVGFCMFVRRTLIDAIGVFDPAFGRGYGEENDFCLRGFAVGYRNVLCDDAFVLHLGGRSFEGQKAELGPRNLAILLERHPHYVAMVQDYIAQDPLRPLREAALARARADATGRAGVLHVVHHHGGGTEQHVRALIDASRAAWRHYLLIALDERWQLEEHLDDGAIRTFDFRREQDEGWAALLEALCASFGIGLVHVHHISACREGLLAALEGSRIPFGFTVHDLHLACPTTTLTGPDGVYCGAETDLGKCRGCLARQSDFAAVDIAQWRARHARILARAAFVIAPSRWAATQLQRYFPGLGVEVIPHGLPAVAAIAGAPRTRSAVLLPRDDIPTVAVLGAIGPDKGARRLERLVEEARRRDAAVRFVLVGYLDREPGPWQSDDARFTIHGAYERQDIADLFAHYRVRLVAFPSAGPESFSFTLSEAWAAGRPVIVPPIGALAERVAGTGAGWLWSEEEWRDEGRMLDAILARIAPGAASDLATAAQRTAAAERATLAAMAERTAELYRRVESPPRANALQPLARARLRDALGYRLWYPPINVVQEPRNVEELRAPVRAHWLVRLRRTWLGQRLSDFAPAPLRAALRDRLK